VFSGYDLGVGSGETVEITAFVAASRARDGGSARPR
jgi:hypothetical protein